MSLPPVQVDRTQISEALVLSFTLARLSWLLLPCDKGRFTRPRQGLQGLGLLEAPQSATRAAPSLAPPIRHVRDQYHQARPQGFSPLERLYTILCFYFFRGVLHPTLVSCRSQGWPLCTIHGYLRCSASSGELIRLTPGYLYFRLSVLTFIPLLLFPHPLAPKILSGGLLWETARLSSRTCSFGHLGSSTQAIYRCCCCVVLLYAVYNLSLYLSLSCFTPT